MAAGVALDWSIDRWPLKQPFRTAHGLETEVETLTVSLRSGGHVGRGEANGVSYRGETGASMAAQVEAVRPAIERGITRLELLEALNPGGARNAIDCALWALEARRTGRPAWSLAGVGQPTPRTTTMTIGAAAPAMMADIAVRATAFDAIKIKLLGDAEDEERVRAVRHARPDCWLGVDANQSFSPDHLQRCMPVLVDARTALIEQPFPAGEDHLLDGIVSPIPIAADESVDTADNLEALRGRYQVVNIKLDKAGGLTAALELARAARNIGMGLMVGNMIDTSLGTAPAFLVAQRCDVVDLDGPLLLATDRERTAVYTDGQIYCSTEVWA